MAYRKGGTDYLSVEWNNKELFDTLNSLSGKVRYELLAKVTMKVAQQMHTDELNAFRSAYSSDAYTDIIASPQRRHSKSKELTNTGMYVQQSFNQRDAVVSTSQKYSDFRLHWFESGSTERQTRKGEYRGSMLSTGRNGRPGFFWNTFNQNGQKYADMLANEINNLIKQ